MRFHFLENWLADRLERLPWRRLALGALVLWAGSWLGTWAGWW